MFWLVIAIELTGFPFTSSISELYTVDKNIKKVRGLKLYKKRHKDIRRLMSEKNYPEIHGDKVWASSYFIMDFLDENPLPKNCNVLEIGCGWGILAIHCAKKFKANVLAVDADELVFPFLDLHARLNRVKVEHLVSKFETIPEQAFSGFDVMLGGDICFWDELVNPLYQTIRRALQHGVKTIMIADPGRSTFLKLAKRCQKDFNALLIPYVVIDPAAYDGYILVIQNSSSEQGVNTGNVR